MIIILLDNSDQLIDNKCAYSNALTYDRWFEPTSTIMELTTLVIKNNVSLFDIELFFSGTFPNSSYNKNVYVCGGDHVHVYGLHIQHVFHAGQETHGCCTVYGGDLVHINEHTINKEVIV